MDPKNKYRNQLFWGDRLVASGGNGLDDVSFGCKGKRMTATVTLTDFELMIDTCPELHQYEEIRRRKGNVGALKQLGYECDLLAQSAYACDGCPKNPDK